MAPTDGKKAPKHQHSGDLDLDELVNKVKTSKAFQKAVDEAVKIAFQQEMSVMREAIESQEGRIHELEASNEKKAKEISHLTTQLEQQRSTIQSLQNNCNDLEQYSRRNCIRLFGVPEKKGEDSMETVCEIAKQKLGVTLPKSAIDRAHRVGQPYNDRAKPANATKKGNEDSPAPPRDKRPRPIIVKLISYQTRRALLSQRRKLKDTGISIHEDLTKKNQKLLSDTRKHSKVISAWSTDGRIVALLPATGGKTITRGIRDYNDLNIL